MILQNFNEFTFGKLLESVTGDATEIKQEVQTVMDELGKEGANDDELKAALLMQAIDNDGEIENIDTERLKTDVREGMTIRGESLNESAVGILHTLEVIGGIMGNMALIEWICGKVEKATGKKPDAKKIQAWMMQVIGVMKKVSGLPAKALEKFFEFIGHKSGLSVSAVKGLELVGMGVVIVFFMTLGIMHFPVLGSSLLMGLFSITGLIGKAVELVKIGREIIHLISNPEGIEGVTNAELNQLAVA